MPAPALAAVLCCVVLMAGGALGSTAALAQEPEDPGSAAKSSAASSPMPRARVSINHGRPIEAQPGMIVIPGSTDAPAGSTVRVNIGDVSEETVVDAYGRFAVEWRQPLDAGRYLVTAALSSPDGRTGSADQILMVRTRLPRRPLTTPSPRYAGPEPSRAGDFQEYTDRWRLVPPPYELNDESPFADGGTGYRFNPYRQNKLKGDFPIKGDDLFFIFTGVSDTLLDFSTAPTPAGVSTSGTTIEFFGGDDRALGAQTIFLSGELYRGLTAFRPVKWRLKGTLAVNVNVLDLDENAGVAPDVREGTRRTDENLNLEELFVEYKIADLSPNYDFVSMRAGIQPFSSDFRGFIFKDINLGVRFFGNLRSNRYQWNVAYFDRLEKDTNSGLNLLELRDQQVGVASLYRQDFPIVGLTTQASVHYVRDEPSFHFDENGFLARPDPTGDFTPHEVEAFYYGLTGFGHLGRYNVDTAFYYTRGDDSLNPIAGRELAQENGEFFFREGIDVEAFMGALEISIDRDWVRPRLAVFYASGDDNLNDRNGRGFDAIFENPNFAGGGFSFWNRNVIRLPGTGVALVNRGSFLNNLKSSKEEGQPNFVNPGIQLASAGVDFELTPRVKSVFTANYLRFDHTEVLEGILFQAPIDEEIGWDLSAGFRFRPFLNQNFVFVGGVGTLLPGDGFEDIFENDDTLYQAFANIILTY